MDNIKRVAFDPKAYAVEKRKSNAGFREACDAFEDEFAALGVLLKA
jgi:hypothetical protein